MFGGNFLDGKRRKTRGWTRRSRGAKAYCPHTHRVNRIFNERERIGTIQWPFVASDWSLETARSVFGIWALDIGLLGAGKDCSQFYADKRDPAECDEWRFNV